MANSPGIAGQLILSSAPVPATAVEALVEQFGAYLAQNSHLDASQRIAWLSKPRVAARTAASLCAYQFSNDELVGVLDAEKRKGCVHALAAYNSSVEALEVIVSHPNGVPAASHLIGCAGYDQSALLEHFDTLTPLSRVELLLNCDRRVSDATIAEHLTRLGEKVPKDGNSKAKLFAALDSLVYFRPGLGTELAQCGYPALTRPAVAASPWITEADVAALLEPEMSWQLRDRIESALCNNLWVNPNGVVRDAVDSSAVHARARLAERSDVWFSQPPPNLNGTGLELVQRHCFSEQITGSAVRLNIALSWHQNLGEHAESVARRLDRLRAWTHLVPLWVRTEATSGFTRRHPGLLSEVSAEATGNPQGYGTMHGGPYIGPADAVGSVNVYENRELLALRVEYTWLLRDALARFSEALGGNGDTWTAAITLSNGFRGSLADLAEIATAIIGESDTETAA